MSVYKLVPNAFKVVTAGYWNDNSGNVDNAMVASKLSDGSDSTTINGSGYSALFRVYADLTTFTVPVNEFAYGVQATVRGYNASSGGGSRSCTVVMHPPGTLNLTTTGSVLTICGDTLATNVGPLTYFALTQANIDQLSLYLRDQTYPSTSDFIFIAEAFCNVLTASVPVAPAITAPAATVADTSYPTVAWTHTDRTQTTITSWSVTSNVLTLTVPVGHGFLAGQAVKASGTADATVNGLNAAITSVTATTIVVPLTRANGSGGAAGVTWIGDDKAQAGYQVQVYTAAQWAAAGSTAGVAGASTTWDSGIVGSSVATATIGGALANGSYVVAVRTAVIAGSNPLTWGAWANSSWTQALVGPGAPTLTATWDAANNRVSLSAQGFGNLLDTDTSTFEASTGLWAARTNCSIATSATFAAGGSQSLKITPAGAGNAIAALGVSASAYLVYVGQQYSASMLSRAGISARTIRLDIEWYDSGETLLSTTTGTGVANSTSNFTTQSSVTGAAPANAHHMRLVVTVLSASGATDVHYIDQLIFNPGGVSAWSLPGLIQYGPGAAIYPFEMVAQRSVDGGATWKTVRLNAGQLQGIVGVSVDSRIQAYTAYDYEAPRGQVVQYQAIEYAQSSSGTVASTPSTVASPTTTVDGTYWLKAMGNPALNRGNVNVRAQSPPTEKRSTNRGVFRLEGRADPVVVQGQQFLDDVSLSITCTTAAEWDAIKALLVYQGTLLLQEPFLTGAGVGIQRWLQVTGDPSWALDPNATPAVPVRRITVDCTAVGAGY